ISKQYNVSAHAVWNILSERGISTREERITYISENSVKLLHEKKIEHKLEMIHQAQEGQKVTEICRNFGVSRKTYYKWIKRYREKQSDIAGLASMRPKGKKHWRFSKGSDTIIKKIIIQYPQYSSRKISKEIAQN